MRRAALPVLLLLLWAAPANAAPVVSVQASPALGPAPLDVTLTASGNAASYHWDLGDGSQADGAVVRHRYEAGRFTATVTARAADGSTTQASATVTAARVTLTGPRTATYGRRTTFKGRLTPVIAGARIVLALNGTPVQAAVTGGAGRFRFRTRLTKPGTFTAASPPRGPRRLVRRPGEGDPGRPLWSAARHGPAYGETVYVY